MELDLPNWQIAAIFALLSAVTFPLGAVIGVFFAAWKKRVNKRLLGFFLGFGAGALIFAVTVELYAEGLHTIEAKQRNPIRVFGLITSIGAAILGALLFTLLDRQAAKWKADSLRKARRAQEQQQKQCDEGEGTSGSGQSGSHRLKRGPSDIVTITGSETERLLRSQSSSSIGRVAGQHDLPHRRAGNVHKETSRESLCKRWMISLFCFWKTKNRQKTDSTPHFKQNESFTASTLKSPTTDERDALLSARCDGTSREDATLPSDFNHIHSPQQCGGEGSLQSPSTVIDDGEAPSSLRGQQRSSDAVIVRGDASPTEEEVYRSAESPLFVGDITSAPPCETPSVPSSDVDDGNLPFQSQQQKENNPFWDCSSSSSSAKAKISHQRRRCPADGREVFVGSGRANRFGEKISGENGEEFQQTTDGTRHQTAASRHPPLSQTTKDVVFPPGETALERKAMLETVAHHHTCEPTSSTSGGPHQHVVAGAEANDDFKDMEICDQYGVSSAGAISEKPGLELMNVAMTMWVVQMIDAIPESMLIGFRTVSNHLSWAFILSVCVANFPESFTGGYIMKKGGFSTVRIVFLWLSVALLTAVVSGLTALIRPIKVETLGITLLANGAQGLAGGAMLALLSSSMLPAAFAQGGSMSGVFCVLGFLASVSIRLFLGLLSFPSPGGEEGGLIQSSAESHSAGQPLSAPAAASHHS